MTTTKEPGRTAAGAPRRPDWIAALGIAPVTVADPAATPTKPINLGESRRAARPAAPETTRRSVDGGAGPVRRKVPAPDPAHDIHARALALLRAGRVAAALALAEEHGPPRPHPAELLLHAVLLARAGHRDRAEALCLRLLAVDERYADAHHLLGACLNAAAAVRHYGLAACLDPAFALPRLGLGRLLRRRGDHDAARAELDRALTLLGDEHDERITLLGGGLDRRALAELCRAEQAACAEGHRQQAGR